MPSHETTRTPQSVVYPFTAIVGQEEMKLALILNVIDPLLGGVLIMGHRGTGKSTAVRALANLLPEIWTVSGCPYGCDPANESQLCEDCGRKRRSGEKLQRARAPVRIVDLPLGATEDRICGTIDIESALTKGFKSFESGLLARANRGFLYIDEVNLLEDHLVDLLLDVAATGRNKVERESISVEHPARFVLLGSGNTEEGELRPQLIDRFGLHVEVKTENDPDRRMEIVELRHAFEKDPASFCESVAGDQAKLRKKIISAQRRLGDVKIDRELLRHVAELCSELSVDGHRGELTIARAAHTLAAFEGRRKVTAEDVRRVAVMSLRHRLRRDPLDEISGGDKIEKALDKVFSESRHSGIKGGLDDRRGVSGSGDRGGESSSMGSRGGDSQEISVATDEANPFVFEPRRVPDTRDRSSNVTRSGRRDGFNARRTRLNYERGRYTAAVDVKGSGARVAIDATLRALAGAGCRVPGVGLGSLRSPDTRHPTPALPAPDTRHPIPASRHLAPSLRYKQLARKAGRLFILAIDASGSMARNRIAQAKGAAVHLLRQSYVRRDRVAIVGFRGTNAEVLLPPSKSMLRASRVLDSLPVGGGTPLSAALSCSLDLAKRVKLSEASGSDASEVFLLVFTDGQANVPTRFNGNGSRAQRQEMIEKEVAALGSEFKSLGVRTIVIDTQPEFITTNRARLLANKLGGTYQRLNGFV